MPVNIVVLPMPVLLSTNVKALSPSPIVVKLKICSSFGIASLIMVMDPGTVMAEALRERS